MEVVHLHGQSLQANSHLPLNLFDHITGRLAKLIYVVLVKDDKGRLTLIVDPGLGKPWSTRRKRHADQVAKECDGMAATWDEAFSLLKKDNPQFEKELIDAVKRKARIIDSQSTKQTSQILDRYGKPTGPGTN